MNNLLKLKDKIKGFKDVEKTVLATQNIAASHIRHLKKNVLNLENYIFALTELIGKLSIGTQNSNHPLLQKKYPDVNKALIILSSDKGLVSGFHHNLINFLIKQKEKNFKITVIGSKAKKYLNEEKIPIFQTFPSFSDIPTENEITALTKYSFTHFTENVFSQIHILYPKFISLSLQIPTIIDFLPFDFNLQSNNNTSDDINQNYGFPIIEPSRNKIINKSVQKYIEVFLYKIIMEAKLSEFAARTVTTEHSLEKTKQLVTKLTRKYFRQRRTVNTQKQLLTFIAHKKTV